MSHTTVDVYPGGDVIFICSDGHGGTKSFRVSSTFLSHASPVFKAMLGPHFGEGTTLTESSSVDIPLPDDNATVMEIICLVLHMRVQDVPATITENELVELANHCDKYDVLEIMRPAINLWLDALLQTELDCSTASESMNVAFRTKLWTSVKRLGLVMVQEVDFDMTIPDAFGTETPHVPFYVFDQLEKHRVQTFNEVLTAVDFKIYECLFLGPQGSCDGQCESANMLKLHFVLQLSEQGLWHGVFGDPSSLAELRDAVRMAEFDNIKGFKRCLGGCSAGSMETTRHIAQLTTEKMAKIMDDMASKLTLDANEKNGMVLGFKILNE